MNPLPQAFNETELPLHVHRLELPAINLDWTHRILRQLRNIGFFVVFVFSIIVVGCVMLTKGLAGRKKTDVSLDTQNKQDAVSLPKS